MPLLFIRYLRNKIVTVVEQILVFRGTPDYIGEGSKTHHTPPRGSRWYSF
jgi:hypothetical protein